MSVEPEETQISEREEAVEQTASAAPEPEAETPEPESEPEQLDPIAAAEARAHEYLELAQRKQAEFENFRKRASAQAAQAEDRGVSRLAKELLPALDHLELALKAAEQMQPTHPAEWVKGIRSVQEEFKTALGRAGIEAFAPLGESFDPTVHEAMAHVPFEGHESGTVAEVYQAGYRLSSGAVIRPARVVVAQ